MTINMKFIRQRFKNHDDPAKHERYLINYQYQILNNMIGAREENVGFAILDRQHDFISTFYDSRCIYIKNTQENKKLLEIRKKLHKRMVHIYIST